MSLLLAVDPRARTPLWKQIVEGVSKLVEDGTLVRGDRLPPTRVLAGRLGVNRSTVCRAYEELWAGGYLESRQGSYSRVRGRERPLAPACDGEPTIDWARVAAPNARKAMRPFLDAAVPGRSARGAIDLARLSADPALCPADDLRRAVRHALAVSPSALLDYGDPAGFLPLRETLARRLRAHGIRVDADEVVLTQGAQQAIDLVLRLLVAPGDGVAIEQPTYGALLPLLALHGARPVGVPMTPDGLDLRALERRLAAGPPRLLYTVPNFQNPTGITTSQAHRERLLGICEAHGVPILEDGFEEDMKYFGRAVMPIKSMDEGGLVIYVGTFSKVIFPGLRIGWIAAARECARRLGHLNRFSSLSGNTVAQAAMERFCQAGRYDAYLRRLHAVYRRRMVALLTGLATHVPRDAVSWTEPSGGCTLWVTIRHAGVADEPALIERCREAGVLIAPGSFFFSSSAAGLHFRLSIARVKAHQLDEACRRLGAAIRGLLATPGPRHIGAAPRAGASVARQLARPGRSRRDTSTTNR